MKTSWIFYFNLLKFKAQYRITIKMAANHLMSYIIVLMNFLSLNQITGQIVNSPIYQTVIISFDGFRASNLDQFINENPNSNFSQFAKSGVKAEFMKPSFPSATFPNHYTLVTGKYSNFEIKVTKTIKFIY